MAHDHGIEVSEYRRQNPSSARIIRQSGDSCRDLWIYVCVLGPTWVWNRKQWCWDITTATVIGPDHYLTEAEAKECLQTVPTKAEEDR